MVVADLSPTNGRDKNFPWTFVFDEGFGFVSHAFPPFLDLEPSFSEFFHNLGGELIILWEPSPISFEPVSFVCGAVSGAVVSTGATGIVEIDESDSVFCGDSASTPGEATFIGTEVKGTHDF